MLDMILRTYCSVLLLALSLAAASAQGNSSPAKGPAIHLLAASSLREAVTEIAQQWSERSGRVVQTQFEASSTLARQISEGAPADVFITADREWLDEVKPMERFDWLTNQLVVVVPSDAKNFAFERLDSLAMASEQVPAGKYARAALDHLHVAIPKRTIYGANVRDVLAKVSEGGAMAGIVYLTDAAVDPGVRVAFTFPPESHPEIVYAVGLLKPGGRALFQALHEPWAIGLARKRGFSVPTRP